MKSEHHIPAALARSLEVSFFMHVRTSLAALSGAALLALIVGCSRQAKTVEANLTPEAPSVAVAKASRQDLSRDLVLTGEFKPYQEIDVMAKVAGYIQRINVDIGDRVQQGQLLAVLEVPEMADDLARGRAALERSQAEVRRAQEEQQRAQSAHEMSHLSYTRLAGVMKDRPGLIAQQEVDDAHSRDLVAEAQVAAAKSTVSAAQEQVKVAQAELDKTHTLHNYTNVTAPFAGIITKRYANTGSMIQAGISSQTQTMPVVRLSQNNLLRLILPVPESVVPQVRVGSAVAVRVPSLKRSFPGRVARTAERVALDTRTMETEVDVPNPNLTLVPGMYAEVNLTIEHQDSALAVPVAAIGGTAQEPVAYVVSTDNRVEVRHIATGMQTATLAEVRSGLQDGDLVVIGNRSQLAEGQTVRPKITRLTASSAE
jgi:RND family efflux transporter MFP subunit